MAPEGVRRSGRIPRSLPILLIGSDVDGKIFSEDTHTVVLSRHGAGIVSRYKLAAEQELIIRKAETNQEAEIRVVGQIGSQDDCYTYGVAFLDPNLNFWGLEFTPLSEPEKQASRVLLECSGCKDTETLDHSDLESDVYAINDGIVRFCKHCGTSTVWKRAITPAPASAQCVTQEPVPSPLPLPAPVPAAVSSSGRASVATEAVSTASAQASVALAENRRKHHRTKINFTACVRQPNSAEDIVACEDVSRGGLRFVSRRSYAVQTFIEVAVPYTEDAPNIFVPAQIVYVQELPARKLFRCGVAYL